MFSDVDQWGLYTPFAYLTSKGFGVDGTGECGGHRVLCSYYNAVAALAGSQGGSASRYIGCTPESGYTLRRDFDQVTADDVVVNTSVGHGGAGGSGAKDGIGVQDNVSSAVVSGSVVAATSHSADTRVTGVGRVLGGHRPQSLSGILRPGERGPFFERNNAARIRRSAVRDEKKKAMLSDWRSSNSARCCVVIPSGEGKTWLADKRPDLFVDHDRLIDRAFLEGLKKEESEAAVCDYLKRVDVPLGRVLLTWSEHTVPEGFTILFEAKLSEPTYLRDNLRNRDALRSPRVFSGHVDLSVAVIRAAEDKLGVVGGWVPTGDRPGFFSGCCDVTREQLRESRAQYYIASNKLRAVKAERELAMLNSPQGVVQQVAEVAGAVSKIKRHTADSAVQGWASTVASSVVKSIADSSSDVPSLDSVGFGASGLRSTDGEELDPIRVGAYQRDIKYVEDSYADMEGFAEEDRQFALRQVKAQYPDVAFTKSQRDVAADRDRVLARLLGAGVSYQCASDAIYAD